jgi:serine/threonine-protein kinase
VDDLPWRLPTDQEWEKASRGVDGRRWPWGDHFVPTWSRSAQSVPRPSPSEVGDPPEDASCYGVWGTAGGVRSWTSTPYELRPDLADGDVAPVHVAVGEFQVVRGGAWTSAEPLCRPAGRFGDRPPQRYHNMGFRLVRSLG